MCARNLRGKGRRTADREQSGCLAIVVTQHNAQALAALDRASRAAHFLARCDNRVVEPLQPAGRFADNARQMCGKNAPANC